MNVLSLFLTGITPQHSFTAPFGESGTSVARRCEYSEIFGAERLDIVLRIDIVKVDNTCKRYASRQTVLPAHRIRHGFRRFLAFSWRVIERNDKLGARVEGITVGVLANSRAHLGTAIPGHLSGGRRRRWCGRTDRIVITIIRTNAQYLDISFEQSATPVQRPIRCND